MGFPGRIDEKKKIAYGFWIGVISIIGFVVWCGLSVYKAIKAPLPPPPAQEVYTRDSPGLIRKTADRLQDNTKQIMDGKPLGKPNGRVYGGVAVTYDTKTPENNTASPSRSGYYSAD